MLSRSISFLRPVVSNLSRVILDNGPCAHLNVLPPLSKTRGGESFRAKPGVSNRHPRGIACTRRNHSSFSSSTTRNLQSCCSFSVETRKWRPYHLQVKFSLKMVQNQGISKEVLATDTPFLGAPGQSHVDGFFTTGAITGYVYLCQQ